jgi:hypothetical protein
MIDINILKDVHTRFISRGICFFCYAGTMLGLVRDNKLIDWDSDIDIAVIINGPTTSYIIREELEELGFEPRRTFYNSYGFMSEQSCIKNNIKIDIFYLCRNENNIVTYTYVEKYFGTYDILNCYMTIICKISEFKIIDYKCNGFQYKIIDNYEKLLELMYGNWKKEDKNYNYTMQKNIIKYGVGNSKLEKNHIYQEDISFVIPYRETKERKVLMDFCLKRIQKFFPHSEIVISNNYEDEFSRGKAINIGVENSNRKYLVIVDADILIERAVIFESIRLLNETEYKWIIPYNLYAGLTKESTDYILSQCHDVFLKTLLLKSKTYITSHEPTGGITIIKHSDYLDVGGFDERLFGWGFDDNIFAHKANIILGSPARIDTYLYHMYHEKIDKSKLSNKEIFEEVSKIKNKEELIKYYKDIK